MEDIYRSQFRLPYSLYEQLKKSADASRRSINSELVARLENSFLLEDLSAMEQMSVEEANSIEAAIDLLNQPTIETRLESVEQQLQQILNLLKK